MPYPPIHPPALIAADHLAYIVAGLRAPSLTKEEWTHGAHLVAAAGLLDELGFDGALEATPGYIRRFNESVGGKNTDNEGYHHTITVLYLTVIGDYCAGRLDKPAHERASALLASTLADKALPLSYYSKERLFSVEARRGFVAPDLKPLSA